MMDDENKNVDSEPVESDDEAKKSEDENNNEETDGLTSDETAKRTMITEETEPETHGSAREHDPLFGKASEKSGACKEGSPNVFLTELWDEEEKARAKPAKRTRALCNKNTSLADILENSKSLSSRVEEWEPDRMKKFFYKFDMYGKTTLNFNADDDVARCMLTSDVRLKIKLAANSG